MAEDYAIVRWKDFAAEDAFDLVQKIEDCITHAVATGYWQVDTSITVASGELVLKAKAQSFSPPPALGNPDDQRIAFQAQASGVLNIGYFPDGFDGGTTTFADVLATSTKSWTGMRNITATSSGFGASATRVSVAQYRDELTTATPYPGNTLAIVLDAPALSEIKYCAMVGRPITCENSGDFGNGLFGDALLVGGPFNITATLTDHAWLRGSQTANAANNSIIRGGATYWHYTRVAYDFNTTDLDHIGQYPRFVPYNLHGFGLARGGTPDNTTHCGIIGQCKYIREADVSYPWSLRLRSRTPGSNQIWRAGVHDANARPQIFLWGPEVAA